MSHQETPEAFGHELAEVTQAEGAPSKHLDWEDLKSVRLSVTAHLGKCALLVRDVLQLRVGSVIALDKQAGDLTDVSVNGLPLGRGEIVPLGDVLQIRITEILGVTSQEGTTSYEA